VSESELARRCSREHGGKPWLWQHAIDGMERELPDVPVEKGLEVLAQPGWGPRHWARYVQGVKYLTGQKKPENGGE
jgi:hypothetical protein